MIFKIKMQKWLTEPCKPHSIGTWLCANLRNVICPFTDIVLDLHYHFKLVCLTGIYLFLWNQNKFFMINTYGKMTGIFCISVLVSSVHVCLFVYMDMHMHVYVIFLLHIFLSWYVCMLFSYTSVQPC